MGILKSFLTLGMSIWLGVAALGPQVPLAWPSVAQEEDKDDDSSGRWEGVAMARLPIFSDANIVT